MRKSTGVTVPPSPLNAIKLELALIIIGSVLVLLLSFSAALTATQQWSLAGGYGLLAALWIIWRTRRTVQRLASARQEVRWGDGGEKSQ